MFDDISDPIDTLFDGAIASLWVELVSELESSPPEAAGTRVGPWRLLDEIGRGGMGTVFLAERADGEFEQRAALKLLRPAIATDEALRRFEQERQILAGLTHPGIARLLDGGRTADGHPYLAMELVDGVPIDRYCRERQLTVRDRLAVFLQVCHAVDHAHRHMVVHRDLKPSNIIVSSQGEVKLLDFGIAKLLQTDPASGTPAMTQTVARVLTPEYASPEQIQGRTVTVASDVYQLGLLLFELLTDRRAQPLRDASPVEIERTVCDTLLARPSAVVDGARRARLLRGDLDSIVQQAVRKAPEGRYASVERLIDDVERHLSGKPVVARGDTLAYRAGRFVRRHRLSVAAAAVAVVLLVAWAATATLQARTIARERDRARAEATKAERVKDFVMRLFQNADPGTARGETLSARELLDRGWAGIQAELAGQPVVQAELLTTVGEIYRELGAYDRAAQLLDRAVEVARTAGDGSEPLLAAALRGNGRLQRERGDFAAAETLLTDALARQRRHFGPEHREVADTLGDLGLTLYSRGDYAHATPYFREALDMRKKLFGEDHLEVAEGLDKLGTALGNLGDYKSAEPLLRKSLELRRRLLPPNHPLLAASLSDLAVVVQSLGNAAAAEALYRESLDVMIKVRGEHHPYVAVTMNNLARLLRTKGDLTQAEDLLRKALAIRQQSLGERHPQVAMNLSDLGRLVYDKGDRASRTAVPRRPGDLSAPSVAGATVFNLGRVLEDRDYKAPSRVAATRSKRQRAVWRGSRAVGVDPAQLGVVQYRQGRVEEAEKSLRDAPVIFRKRLPEGHQRLAEALALWAKC